MGGACGADRRRFANVREGWTIASSLRELGRAWQMTGSCGC